MSVNQGGGRSLPWGRAIGWTALFALFAYVMIPTLHMRFGTPGAAGPSLMHKQAWYCGHFVTALPTVVIGALQFSSGLRATRPTVHRWLGRTYVALALPSAVAGFWLACVTDDPGSRIPAAILALLWFGFTLGGWLRARASDYTSHRLLMIRSYALIFVFIWSRIDADPVFAPLWAWIKDPNELMGNQAWFGILVPILLVEAWLSWRPLLLGRTRATARAARAA
ncbi:MAG: DUF2306 domain-containing protein [Proteobacteria bacterium]|nr:DUF2306 domain-containing protein [Pseudomonadota bacterium]